MLSRAAPGATVLVNTPCPRSAFWATLPQEAQHWLVDTACRLFVIDGYAQSEQAGLGRRINTVMQLCFFALTKVLPINEALASPAGLDWSTPGAVAARKSSGATSPRSKARWRRSPR